MALFGWRKKKQGSEAEATEPADADQAAPEVTDDASVVRSETGSSTAAEQRAEPLDDDLDNLLDELDLDEPEEVRPLQGSLDQYADDEPLPPLGQSTAPVPDAVADADPVLDAVESPFDDSTPAESAVSDLDPAGALETSAFGADAGADAGADLPEPVSAEVLKETPTEDPTQEAVHEETRFDSAGDEAVAQPAPPLDPALESPETDAPGGEDDAGSVGLFGRLKRGLSKSRKSLAAGIGNLILGEREIDENALEDLETALLMADVGVDATRRIIDELTPQVERRELNNTDALFAALSKSLAATLAPSAVPFKVDTSKSPFVVLVVGVNGVGKTTSIGKLARRFQDEGHSVLLAAGDTFRAAAVEQLQEWGVRNDITVVAQAQGSDSASVIFDAMEAARARNIDIVLADTAGRLHNKSGLMGELEKIGRIMGRFEPDAPHEVLLVIDGGTGQNALAQVKEFSAAVAVTGLIVTKLDGTAKGGIVFAASETSKLPIYFIGVGEQIDDMRPFAPDDFVRALLDRSDE